MRYEGDTGNVMPPDDEDEPRHCDKCGAICDMRIGYCECDPAVCPYPPVQ